MPTQLFNKPREDILKGVTNYAAVGTTYHAMLCDFRKLAKFQNTNRMSTGKYTVSYVGTGRVKKVFLGNVFNTSLVEEIGLSTSGVTPLVIQNGAIVPSGAVSGMFYEMTLKAVNLVSGVNPSIQFNSFSRGEQYTRESSRALVTTAIRVEGEYLTLPPTSNYNKKDRHYVVVVEVYTEFKWTTINGHLQFELWNPIIGKSLIKYRGTGATSNSILHSLGSVPTLVEHAGLGTTHHATMTSFTNGVGTIKTAYQTAVGISTDVSKNPTVSITAVALGDMVKTNLLGTWYQMRVSGISSHVVVSTVVATATGITYTAPLNDISGVMLASVPNSGVGRVIIGGKGFNTNIDPTELWMDVDGISTAVIDTTYALSGRTVTFSPSAEVVSGNTYLLVIETENISSTYTGQDPLIPIMWSNYLDVERPFIRSETVLSEIEVKNGFIKSDPIFMAGVVAPCDVVIILRKTTLQTLEQAELMLWVTGNVGLPYLLPDPEIILTFTDNNKFIAL